MGWNQLVWREPALWHVDVWILAQGGPILSSELVMMLQQPLETKTNPKEAERMETKRSELFPGLSWGWTSPWETVGWLPPTLGPWAVLSRPCPQTSVGCPITCPGGVGTSITPSGRCGQPHLVQEQPKNVGTVCLSMLLTGRLRQREVKCLVRGHTAKG